MLGLLDPDCGDLEGGNLVHMVLTVIRAGTPSCDPEVLILLLVLPSSRLLQILGLVRGIRAAGSLVPMSSPTPSLISLVITLEPEGAYIAHLIIVVQAWHCSIAHAIANAIANTTAIAILTPTAAGGRAPFRPDDAPGWAIAVVLLGGEVGRGHRGYLRGGEVEGRCLVVV